MILNTIDQLQRLENTLRRPKQALAPADALKMRKVSYDVKELTRVLDDLAGKMVTRAGSSVEDIKGKLRSESEKRRAGQLGAVAPCDPVQKSDGPDLQGCMIALYPAPEVQKAIAVKGGEPSDRIHLTVAFFEDAASDRDDWDMAGAILTELARHLPVLRGTLTGTGRFVHDDGEVAYATADIQHLELWRKVLVEQLESAGFPVSKKYPWRPHLTLQYMAPDADFPDTLVRTETVPVEFSEVCMVQGEKRVTTAPFKVSP